MGVRKKGARSLRMGCDLRMAARRRFPHEVAVAVGHWFGQLRLREGRVLVRCHRLAGESRYEIQVTVQLRRVDDPGVREYLAQVDSDHEWMREEEALRSASEREETRAEQEAARRGTE
jgi:hypothetical protein